MAATSEFELLDSSLFEKIGDANYSYIRNQEISTAAFTYCDVCAVPMDQTSSGLECPKCHVIKQIFGSLKDLNVENSSRVIKTSYKNNNKSTYTSIPDNTKAQHKQILDQLTKLNEQCTPEARLPRNIIESAATKYNEVQKLIIDRYDANGEVCGTKKFVRRGGIKDETLGALVYFSCVNAKLSKKKRDIVDFMGLESNGISKGEIILRALHNEGKITIPIHAEPSDDFSNRYLESLELIKYDDDGITEESERYKNFVDELVETSIKNRISMNIVNSSKIVGSIWVLITHLNLPISTNQVEEACGHIRKNTFTNFSQAVEKNILQFIGVFDKYKIPHGVKGLVVRKRK